MLPTYIVLIIPEGNVTDADIKIFESLENAKTYLISYLNKLKPCLTLEREIHLFDKAMENLITWSGNEKYLFDDGNVYEIRRSYLHKSS